VGEKILVKVMRHTLTRFETGDMHTPRTMKTANALFDEAASHLAHSTGNVAKVELWLADRLVKYADEDGVFDVKYTKAGVYQGVEEVNE